jgi:hypothetical protein
LELLVGSASSTSNGSTTTVNFAAIGFSATA